MTTPPWSGLRVLIVEDRYFVASELADRIARWGAEVVGPARNLSQAADLVAAHDIDIALLDVNLDGDMVFPLADALADRGLPFIFLTGYDDETLPPEWRGRPRLSKPVNHRALADLLMQVKLKKATPS